MNKKTLVFGASLKAHRYSNIAIRRLLDSNIPVVAFGMRSGSVAEVQIDRQLMPYKEIHTVTLYMNPTRQEPFYEYILNLNPERVVFNPGTENPALIQRLEQHNIEALVACTLVLLATNQY